MELKVYVDRMSQPSRALLIFCKANGIEFEEVKIVLAQKQHHSPEYVEINPMKQVPSIVHGDFKLFESHAILVYLASAFSGVADHCFNAIYPNSKVFHNLKTRWYPADVRQRAKIHSVLDWHHSNLRRGSVGFLFNSGIVLAFGRPLNPTAAAEGEKLLSASLSTIESYWLKEDGPFLLGNSQPSIADLALVCEVMQIEAADENDRERILAPRKRILKWVEDVKNATAPHFDEIHMVMSPMKEMLKQLRAQAKKQ